MSTDNLKRFIFDNLNIRGELVVLEKTTNDMFSKHQYPSEIKQLLGQMACSSLLLSATLKIQGSISIQASGSGPVSAIMAEATNKRTCRGIARYSQTPADGTLKSTLGEQATLVMTITPSKGQRYQGIVELTQDHLAGCIEDYFAHSEQLATRLWLFQADNKWGGLLLQQLPEQKGSETHQDDWERVCALAATLTSEELLDLDAETVLHRLFHEETVRVLEDEPTEFWCSCSEDRTLEVIKSLGKDEAFSILDDMGKIDIDCQFCYQHYSFERERIEQLFADPTVH
ncbi:Hsp33 family molecular chaperone [Hahella sp. CCB-MM4]|uniref:Hsp33 family molecular chaperone HslO n=1 Tax=Hahella sp. (strain CCB-MM4) TaxID=1926491 RepID=UPI000B9A6946|nr:Hsp33 family molecular chaperone HslO [Hahella sp. CCB-MM4]OZG75136.1 Hsp33 family molecular chaperone [Hahella sp. CCB-MM4]